MNKHKQNAPKRMCRLRMLGLLRLIWSLLWPDNAYTVAAQILHKINRNCTQPASLHCMTAINRTALHAQSNEYSLPASACHHKKHINSMQTCAGSRKPAQVQHVMHETTKRNRHFRCPNKHNRSLDKHCRCQNDHCSCLASAPQRHMD